MKKSKLIKLLSSADEDDVMIEIDGTLYNIAPDLGHEEEKFDGFATAFPAVVYLKSTDADDEDIYDYYT